MPACAKTTVWRTLATLLALQLQHSRALAFLLDRPSLAPALRSIAARSRRVEPYAQATLRARRAATACSGPRLSMAVADVEFEKQELQVIFDTMQQNNLFFSALGLDQKEEILQLLKAMTNASEGAVDTKALARSGSLVGKWKLEFSNEERYRILPPGADVFNYVFDAGEKGRLDNILRFYNSWVLRSIRAISQYRVDSDGRVLFMFNQLMVDLFGVKVPLPFFGEQGGYLEMQYFDGTFWVERFEEELLDESGSHMAYNVFRRVGDVTEPDKTEVPARA